jgi:hypothetical protein
MTIRKRDGSSPREFTDSDFAQDRMGRNKLQGDDQAAVRNQRQAVSDVKPETDDVIESLEKMDKDVRAREDLGKGSKQGR